MTGQIRASALTDGVSESKAPRSEPTASEPGLTLLRLAILASLRHRCFAVNMDSTGAPTLHENEPHRNDLAHRLNWLRAGVLGANDGIVSVAAIVVGVAGVTTDSDPILIAGAAGVVGGAISMALGEYVSVSCR